MSLDETTGPEYFMLDATAGAPRKQASDALSMNYFAYVSNVSYDREPVFLLASNAGSKSTVTTTAEDCPALPVCFWTDFARTKPSCSYV